MRRGGVLLWDRMTTASAGEGEPAYAFTGSDIGLALGLLDAAFAEVDPAKSGGPRAVPSAGALYPYEFRVLTEEADGPAVFHVDPVRRLVFRVDGGCSADRRCEPAGLRTPAPGGALVFVVGRPWLSMRKYGDRGYRYAQFDAAHVATNLLGVAGPGAELRLRFGRTARRPPMPTTSAERTAPCSPN